MPTIFLIVLILFSSTLYGDETEKPFGIIKKHIDKLMEEYDVPGVAVALVYQGKSYLYQFGYVDRALQKPVTDQTIFELASLTKVFTSTALAWEVIQGKMVLNAPVTQYIPLLRNTITPISQVKLIDLATHTSSLPRVPPNPKEKQTSQSLITFLQHWKPGYPIGTKYVYSNLAFALLGYAIGRVENEDYEKVIKKLISTPLQMTSTFVHVPAILLDHYAQGYTKKGEKAKRTVAPVWPGGGALKSTSRDMLKFLRANLDLEGSENLRKAMQFAQQGFFKVKEQLTMGLGWQRFTTKKNLLIIDKNGGLPGFSTYIGMIPHLKLGIVILTNKAKTHSTRVGRKILIKLSKK